VKLREGYNMEEVDGFLDEVEAELGRLHREIDDLTAKAAAAPMAAAAPPPAPVEAVIAAPVPVAAPAAAPTDAAVRMLELAQKTADEYVNAAKSEAATILADAQATHQRTMGDLESERASVQAKVDGLRAFEKEYRTRLRSYLEGQLRDLEAKAPTGTAPAASDAPAASAAPPLAPQAAQAAPAVSPVSVVPAVQGAPSSTPQTPQTPRPFSPAPAPDAPSGPPVQAD
jgi:cell division septum initiation protein DivIVA